MSLDIRWKQRFENFDRAVSLLRDALACGAAALSPLEQEGVAQRFEYTFELAWKTLKDFLEHQGSVFSPVTARTVFKEGMLTEVLPHDTVWIDMLENRNKLSHTYDEEVFTSSVEAIESRYLPALLKLHSFLKGQL